MSLCSIRALVALLPSGNTGFFRAIARYGQYALLAPAMCSGVPPLRAYAAFFARPLGGRSFLRIPKKSFLFFIASNHVLNYICTPLARDAVRYKPIVALT